MIYDHEKFILAFGETPIQDDLERTNCMQVGELGHQQCGVCDIHNKPRFMCGCLAPLISNNLARTKDMNVSFEQKQKFVFIHHALWSLCQELPETECMLIARISEFRNEMEALGLLKVGGEDDYTRAVFEGGIKLLGDVTL